MHRVLTHQVASLKRQLEFSQMQVSELQQTSADVRNSSEMHEVDAGVQCKLSTPGLQVSRFTCVFV